MIEYYAKSEELSNGERKYTEPLFVHLNNTLAFAEKLIIRYNITDYNLIQAIKIAAAFHDIGKADRRFQEYLIDSTKGKAPVYHPLLSLSIIEQIARSIFTNKKGRSIKKNLKNLVILAVASHHTPLHQNLYTNISNDDVRFLKVIDKGYFENIILQLAKQIGLNNIISTNLYNKRCTDTLDKARVKIDPLSINEGIKLREYFVTIQGILNFSDWLASGLNSNNKFDVTLLNLKYDLVKDPYYYQTKAGDITENIFITLPTGSGKTEAALLWILKNFVQGFRVFYTLPTTTTINGMFKRLVDSSTEYGLDKETVAMYHSNVDLYLSLEGTNPKRETLNLYRNFFYPFNITTPDQLMLAMMNQHRYTLKSFLMSNSLIVFDEIHAYDSETFGLIKALIKHLYSNYNVKFCIMSATFPTLLKKELSFLKAKELINKKLLEFEYKKRKRTHFKVRQKYISQTLDEIISNYEKGKKVLIIMNTVKRAQKIFIALNKIMKENNYSSNDLLLIHSRFTYRDKVEKEKLIYERKNKYIKKKPKILVSTQVVEVSLDIDYDIMFTEACYPDSLTQRAGRINRYGILGNNGEGLVNIFLPENWNENFEEASLPYDPIMLGDSISLLTLEENNISSEYDYVRLTNNFYDKSWRTSEEAEERFKMIWREINYIYRTNLSDENMLKLLRTRSGILTVSAYSRTHWDIIEQLDNEIYNSNKTNQKYDLYRKIRTYSINVPLIKSVSLSYEMGKNDIKYTIVQADYDPLLGLKINL